MAVIIELPKVYTAQKLKKENLNCTEKYQVLPVCWPPLIFSP